MKGYTVTVEIRGRENSPMTYTTYDKQDAQRFAAYYKNKYKYPSVSCKSFGKNEKIPLENIDHYEY